MNKSNGKRPLERPQEIHSGTAGCEFCQHMLSVINRHVQAGHPQSPLWQLFVETSAATGVAMHFMAGPSKAPLAVSARRAFAAEARVQGYTLNAIGRHIHRHHTTVLNLLVGKGWQKR